MKRINFVLLFAFAAALLTSSCRKEAALATAEKEKSPVLTGAAPGNSIASSLASLPVGGLGGPYRIVNEQSGKVLEVELSEINNNGGKVQQWEYLNKDNQKWILTALGNEAYIITNVWSGKVLEAQASTAYQNGGRVQQWSWLQYGNQQWKISGKAFINVGSGKVLDLSSTTVYVNGGIIQVWDWVNGANQRWTLQTP
ncbi:RICIN domain-containing protein [Chitinophaga sp. RAB17]|uniref:RICIN domain-containing protein n=1 Tax=Chitinophaga sp. RAB17 TaxID=3233049 RepID=UPI003F8E5F7B